jgi:excisionase family DNA binding protein
MPKVPEKLPALSRVQESRSSRTQVATHPGKKSTIHPEVEKEPKSVAVGNSPVLVAGEPEESMEGTSASSSAQQADGRNQRTPRPSREYLRTAEVAELLHVSSKTISRWAREGKLPSVRTLGGHRRFPEQPIREVAARLSGDLALGETPDDDVIRLD